MSFWSNLKPAPKAILIALLIGSAIFGARHWMTNFGATKSASTQVEAKGQLSDFQDSAATAAPDGDFVAPSAKVAANLPGMHRKVLTIPWNATQGFLLAIGGPRTTQGSLMAKYGVNLTVERQNDYPVLQEQLVACANQLAKGEKQCTTGTNFVIIMGDGAPTVLTGLNATLSKLGPDYEARIIGAVGRSNGEDVFMAPKAVRDNPANAKGLVVAAVKMDGDWNIAMLFARANDICNNPDPSTYDPECLNWVATSSFVEADDKYIQGYCEERPVVRENRKTGETKKVCVTAVATWTPGDVAVAKAKGGIVPIMSTRDNPSQMAATVIGIKKDYLRDGGKDAMNMLRAALEAGNQIKASKKALMTASGIAAKVFGEQDASYWAKYYVGVEEMDATGEMVRLGGSAVFNIADNIQYFGLDGGENKYAITYALFGDIAKQQYPQELSSYLPVQQVLDTTLIARVAKEATKTDIGVAEVNTFTEEGATTAQTIATRSYDITFATGKAVFTGAATSELDGQILPNLVVADNTRVEVHGHTDDTGTVAGNDALSQARAQAVADYLKSKAPGSFPAGRMKVFAHGQRNPVASNGTAEGRAQNRRVEIVIKSN